MDDLRQGLCAYLRQQKEIGTPDYVLSAPLSVFSVSSPAEVAPVNKSFTPTVIAPTSAPAGERKKEPVLISAAHLHAGALKQAADPGRDALVKLYNENKNCKACGLGRMRKNFVFGSGNACAGLMVIGEAPGAEEDEQGLPFVGRAGELLTKMLAAIGCDRKKDVFIANVLKCRPPENRNPDADEILACRHILLSQIEIIKPRVILLLGRIAAHTLLDAAASIATLRTQSHTVAGVPAFVTYHPAALLRNEEHKRPAWEDLKKVQKALAASAGANGKNTTEDHADQTK